MDKRKRQTMIYKTFHKETLGELRFSEECVFPTPLVAPVVLQVVFTDTSRYFSQ